MSDHDDDEALLNELRRLDDGPEPPPELWATMAANVRAGHARERAARRRRWRTRTLAATTSALALAAALTLWLRPSPPVAPPAESFDEMTVFGDEVGPGDELEEMSAAQLDKLDAAFKKGA